MGGTLQRPVSTSRAQVPCQEDYAPGSARLIGHAARELLDNKQTIKTDVYEETALGVGSNSAREASGTAQRRPSPRLLSARPIAKCTSHIFEKPDCTTVPHPPLSCDIVLPGYRIFSALERYLREKNSRDYDKLKNDLNVSFDCQAHSNPGGRHSIFVQQIAAYH
ncbi:hypothetical protein KIN20_004435 [Parelaphostrongylus tenuis]|uniref:Uncharacterized protein n=1 Tax=Parelaphostrongylus tenuis TaxID=148309 RepID=A0AAD5MJY1_PARTN|nr:hypothetical protein KIN20_004435 [Parelaphostrongylus tenuis]